MKRAPEPELMDEKDQAEAYANGDFEESHSKVIRLFDTLFPGVEIKGSVLDLGCGPGDITFRFAHRFSEAKIIGIDGSAEMIRLAGERRNRELISADRVQFIRAMIPGIAIPGISYDLIISTSFFHHLHNPMVLWDSIKQYAGSGTKILVVDLFRPVSKDAAKQLTDKYMCNEPSIVKRDFYNSLLAAFEPDEVKDQLSYAGLSELSVRVISDRHMVMFGKKE